MRRRNYSEYCFTNAGRHFVADGSFSGFSNNEMSPAYYPFSKLAGKKISQFGVMGYLYNHELHLLQSQFCKKPKKPV